MINRILLIDIEDIGIKKRNLANENWSHYPIGLMYLASSVKEDYSDIEIKIFHTYTSESPLIELVGLIEDFQPDLVGLRGLSVFKNDFYIIARTIKKILPQKYLVAGGPYPSISYKEVLMDKSVDMVLLGEGEITFKEIVHSLRKDGVLPSKLSGTALLVNGCVVKNKQRTFIANLDNIPFPDYDLIDCTKYTKAVNQTFISGEYASMFTSRGCPFQCFYCHKLFGKSIRRRSPENIVSEMKHHYYKRNIRNFIFLDDVFNIPIDKAKQVLKIIAQNFKDIHLSFPNGLRADHIDDEFIDLLEECGTIQVTLAIESASSRLQKYMGKNLNIDLAYQNIDKISRKFITTVMYMIGFPTETLAEADETIFFAEQFKYVAQPVLNILRVYEDSPILNILQPSQKQMKMIIRQSQFSHSERLFHNGKAVKPTFYGDYFSSRLVPLKSRDIFRLNVKWIHNVINCKNRIANSYTVMKKFLNDKEILSFYKRFFNNYEFELTELLEMMYFGT